MKNCLACVASATLALLALPLACVSNTQAPTSGDAGDTTPLGDDASLPFLDATVNSPGEPSTDAGAPLLDARIDTALPDAGPSPLTLRVLLGGAPEPGVAVVFQDATGAFVSSATTDTTGSVSQLVTAGSQVSVALGTVTVPNLVTIQAVEPGDVLTLVDTATSSAGVSELVNTTLPAATWDAAGVTEYLYAGHCGNSAGFPLSVNANCQANGQFPLFARAQGQGGVEVAYTYQTGNALVPDGGLPTDGGDLALVVARPWSTSTATQTITTSALPAAFTGTVAYTYAEVSGGVTMTLLPTVDVTSDAGILSSSYPVHAGFADFVQTEAYATLGAGASTAVSVVAAATRGPAPAMSQVAALDLSVLPPITAATVDSADAGTITQPIVNWTSSGSLAAAAGIVVAVQWSSSPTDGAPSASGTWTIVAPPSATSVRTPAMPTALAGWVPAAGGYINVQPRVTAIQGTFVPDYASLRSRFAGLPLFDTSWQATIPPLPASGAIAISVFYPNEG